MQVLIPSLSPAKIVDGVCQIDRKFHTGMLRYAEVSEWELVCVVRLLGEGEQLMDAVEVPVADLPYRVHTVACDPATNPEPNELAAIESLVRSSRLVYGLGLRTEIFARKHGVPYIAVTEYTLRTQLQMARLQVRNPLRKASRQLKTALRFAGTLRSLVASESVHCNGYPTFNESRPFNSNRLLYLDSRMSEQAVIAEGVLASRLSTLAEGRRPKLLFSGRYSAIKGALDVVKVGVELQRMGIDFELHLYGKGEQKADMVEYIERASAGSFIHIHDAVPYPELVEITRTFDVFVCCHLQGDPSCTYLESMGAGLPVVGYANEMWRAMARESEAGVAVASGDTAACARQVAQLLDDRPRLGSLSRQARSFALEHAFEREFDLRVQHMRRLTHAGALP